MNKTAIILAEGFEEVEGLTAVDLLRRAGIVCDMLSLDDAPVVVGSHGIEVRADLGFSAADFDSYDGVILPGGLKGTRRLSEDARVIELLQRFHAAGKLTAAICAGPTVLGQAGILQGLRAVCYPGVEDRLTGATTGTEAAVTDGTVITSRGMGTSVPFGLAIVRYFQGEEAAEALARKVVWQN